MTAVDLPTIRSLQAQLHDPASDVAAAIAAGRPLQAAQWTLAARLAGHPFRLEPAQLLWILPRVQDPVMLPCLVGCCSSPPIAELIAFLEGETEWNSRASALLTCALLVKSQVPPPALVQVARRCSLECYGVYKIPVAAACQLLEDDDLRRDTAALFETVYLFGNSKLTGSFERCLAGDFREALPDFGSSGLTARRLAPKVGRNDPCPCGSGKKHKKCCEGKAEASYAAVAPARATRAFIPYVMPTHALLELDPSQLDNRVLGLLIEELGQRGLLEEAQAALEVLLSRDNLDGHRDEIRFSLLMSASERGDVGTLEAQVRALDPDGPYAWLRASLLGLLEHPRLDEWNQGLVELVRDPLHELTHAFFVLDLCPALGILLARSALCQAGVLDADTCLDAIHEARQKLGLEDEDPSELIWERLQARPAEKPGPAPSPDDALKTQLAAATTQARALQDKLQAAEQSLAAQQRLLATAPVLKQDPEETRRLRGKVHELKATLQERNAERAQLRQQLRATSAVPAQPLPVVRDPVDSEDGLASDEERRAPLLAVFSKPAEEDWLSLPTTQQRLASRLLGELAAGDELAWKKTKRLQETHEDLLSVRLGLHHRMLFRMEGRQRLMVERLIPRESQERVLREYRRRV